MGSMSASSPADMGFFIEERYSSITEFIDGFVHGLGVLGLMFDRRLIEVFKFVLFVIGDLHGVPETELLTIDSLNLFPRGFLILFEEFGEEIGEYPRRTFLMAELIQMERIIAVPESESSSLMVGCNEDKGLVGVLLIESVRHFHRLIHVPYFADSCSGIIPMTCIIDHTPLHHHKEAVVTRLKEGDGGGDNLREGKVSLLAINSVREVRTMYHACVRGLDEDHLRDRGIRRLRYFECLFIAMRDGVPGFPGFAIEVTGFIIVFALRMMETGSAEEIKL